MAYQVIMENAAQKEYKRLSPPWNAAVKKAIDALESNPRPPGVKKLAGTGDGYRTRTGSYRILYTIDDKRKIVTVYRIRHRKEAYR